MNTEQILMCVVALILGMLLANMLKSVCGCKVVEGQAYTPISNQFRNLSMKARIAPNYGYKNPNPDIQCLPIDGSPRRGTECDGRNTWQSCLFESRCIPYSMSERFKLDDEDVRPTLTKLKKMLVDYTNPSKDLKFKTLISECNNDVDCNFEKFLERLPNLK
jgi:hypothetical protein